MSQDSAIARWQALVEGRRDQMDAAYARLGRDSSDFWSRRAGRFRRFAGVSGTENPLVQRVLSLLPPGGTVLDVGAGTGRYTLPIAQHAGKVVAVEPSAEMAAHLLQDAEAAGIGNIRLIQQDWQEVDREEEPADVVLCTHVLYPHADIETWLHTLDAHARVAVVLELMAAWGEPPILLDLWQRFHNEPRVPQPSYVDAYAVLHELGVPANVEVYETGPSTFWHFADLEEAVAAAREHLILPASADVDEALRTALGGSLEREGDARVLSSPRVAATVWWEREGPRLPGALGTRDPADVD